ncbi:MAG: cation:proton antiporter [Gammaproteobacteria bacterium]|nr:cation:proton antiporter [Gammaproteobacteria bacterium]
MGSMNFILYLGVLLLLGLASTRVVKLLKLPNVTGYLVVGLLSAIICIVFDKFIFKDTSLAEGLTKLNNIVSNVALGFIALSIGEEFKLSKIKANGSRMAVITILQALFACILVDIGLILACKFLGLNIGIAICLGAIATATAPAATLMVIHQYKAEGPLVDTLLPVVAGDDAVGLVVFSISVSIAKIFVSGAKVSVLSLLVIPLIEIIGSLIVGFVYGFLMHFLIKFFKSRNNHAIVIIAFTLLGAGTCIALNRITIAGESMEFSNLLCCMMIGAVYVNLANSAERPIIDRDVELIDRWTPFLFMLFFVLSGTHLATSAYEIISTNSVKFLIPVLIVFVTYTILRSLGKYFGAFFGCKIVKESPTVTKYLGITLLPQAGVAIGMANQISAMADFQKDNTGNIIVTVVLCATLVYELVGPLLTKKALEKAGEIPEIEAVPVA